MLWLAAQAAWVSICRSHRLPLVVRPLLRLPALSLFPGHIPAHDAKWSAVGNCSMFGPISAITVSAARCSTPGIGRLAAENLVAEIGVDMGRFPTADHLASWAGMAPGNHESAGKRKSGKTTKGSRWLRQMLTQAAWAASHTKDTYLSAQYRRLAARRGKKRALVALGHTLLVIMYHLLKNRTTYQELGGDFLERLEPDRLTRQLVQRLEKLGHNVTLRPKEDAA